MKPRAQLLTLLLAALLAAPLAAAAQVTALKGATIYTLAGAPIENGTLVIRDGKIAAVGGPETPVPAGAKVIDAKGLRIYPGLFDAVSRLGLTEVGAVSATVDTNELGRYNPHLLAATAVHPPSEHIPVARANGITHAVSAPGSGGGGFFGGFAGAVMPGQGSLINLSGWTVEEMLIKPSVGLILNWPSIQTRTFDFSTFEFREKPFTEAKKEFEERIAELEEWMQAAQHYAQVEAKGATAKVERELKIEALARALRGEIPVLFMANSARDIRNAVEFAEKKIPVILRPTQSLPGEEDEPYDRPFTNAGELHAAGVKVAFATFDSSDSRTLPYEAANAVPYGLPYEEALKGITLYPAQMLGVDKELGTLEAGKRANFIVTDGDPLEFKTEVKRLFINGVETSTDNKHRQLWEKYRARP